MTDELEAGMLAMDIANQSMVEIVDPDVGTFAEQDAAMRDLISYADGNKAVGFDDDTLMVEVRYIGINPGEKTYTMPITRIETSKDLITAVGTVTQRSGIVDSIHEGLRVDKGLSRYV